MRDSVLISTAMDSYRRKRVAGTNEGTDGFKKETK